MANVITTAATLDDSLITLIDQEVIVSGAGINKIDAFVETKVDIGAKSIDFTIYSKLAKATTALTDGQDLDSVALADSSVTFTPKEYGNVVSKDEDNNNNDTNITRNNSNNANNFLLKSKKINIEDKKDDYKSINTYKPAGNLIYNEKHMNPFKK